MPSSHPDRSAAFPGEDVAPASESLLLDLRRRCQQVCTGRQVVGVAVPVQDGNVGQVAER
jgi:hypothetical protein